MFQYMFRVARVNRTSALLLSALLLAVPTFTTLPVLAQSDRSAGTEAANPVEEFAWQIEELKKTFTDLGSKIEHSVSSIDGLTDVEKARKEIESLRAIVGGLLGAVSDNGVVSQLGVRALGHTRDKLKQLENDTRFTREERQFLLDEWRKLEVQTQLAAEELGQARGEFVELLRTLQTREDFIDELMQIQRAAEAVKVIRQLTSEIRIASDRLKALMLAIRPPGV